MRTTVLFALILAGCSRTDPRPGRAAAPQQNHTDCQKAIESLQADKKTMSDIADRLHAEIEALNMRNGELQDYIALMNTMNKAYVNRIDRFYTMTVPTFANLWGARQRVASGQISVKDAELIISADLALPEVEQAKERIKREVKENPDYIPQSRK